MLDYKQTWLCEWFLSSASAAPVIFYQKIGAIFKLSLERCYKRSALKAYEILSQMLHVNVVWLSFFTPSKQELKKVTLKIWSYWNNMKIVAMSGSTICFWVSQFVLCHTEWQMDVQKMTSPISLTDLPLALFFCANWIMTNLVIFSALLMALCLVKV